MLTRLIVICIFLALGSPIRAQDEAALKQRVQARSQAVSDLLAAGLVHEGPGGLLKATMQLDAQQNQTVQAENKDRQAIFAIIAQKSRLPVDEVARLFAARAKKAAPITSAGFGPCELIPAKEADVLRLLQYLKQGMHYASQKRFDLALAEFQPALAIDKSFLGLQHNVGAAQLALGKFAEAETAFKAELKLVECLTPLTATQLALFGYFMEVEDKNPVTRKQAQAQKLKGELPKVEAGVHYNLACLYSRQRRSDQALSELRAAVGAGFSDKKSLSSDPDLAFARSLPEFREVLNAIR